MLNFDTLPDLHTKRGELDKRQHVVSQMCHRYSVIIAAYCYHCNLVV